MEPVQQGTKAERRKLSAEEIKAAKRKKADGVSMQSSPETMRSPSAAQMAVFGSDDMLCSILAFLPAADKCRPDRCSLVDKHWNRCCKNSAAWNTIEGQDDEKFLQRAPSSRFWNLLPRLGRPFRVFKCSLHRRYRRDDGSCDDAFQVFVKKCPKLRVLLHSGRFDPRLRLASEGFKQLEHLSVVSNEREVTDDELLLALERVGGKLKSFRLIRTDPRPFHYVRTMPQLALPNLGILCPKLEVFTGCVNDTVLRGLCHAENLKELVLIPKGRCTKGLECLLQSVSHQITSLVICWGDNRDEGHWINYSTLFEGLSFCSALERLALQMANSIGDDVSTEQFAAFLSATSQTLTAIEFGNCKHFTDEHSELIASRCPALERFAIVEAPITDEGLAFMASGCPRLIDLSMRHCADITDDGLLTLLTASKLLQRLNVSGCPHVSEGGKDRAIVARQKLGLKELQIFRI